MVTLLACSLPFAFLENTLFFELFAIRTGHALSYYITSDLSNLAR